MPRVWLLLVGLLVVSQHGVRAGQGNIYQGLWGGLFARQANANRTSLFSGLQAAAEGWKESASDLQASLQAKLGEHEGHGLLDGLIWPLNATLGLLQSAGDSGASGTSGLEALYRHVSAELANADPKTLAAVAVIQAWALASLLKKKDGGSSTSALDRLRYPMPLPDPQWGSFHPAICLRLQNFAGTDGYRALYLAPGACSGQGQQSVEALGWGGSAAFSLDCAVGEREAGDEGAGPPAAEASWISSALSSLLRSRDCTLGVATAGGAGGLLTFSDPLPTLGAPELNAMRLRLCNMALGQGNTAAVPSPDATWLLRRLKLNGRPLLPPEGRPAPSVTQAEGCATSLYYVRPKATSSGFSLDGALELGAELFPPGTGIGEAASLEISLGEYSLASAAASILLGSDSTSVSDPG